MVILPKLTGAMSIFAASFVLYHILRSQRRRKRVYSRLVLMMSLQDFLFAVKQSLSSWVIPQGSVGTIWAVGSQQTCTAAGFVGQGSGLTSILYNGSLSIFFLLTVRYNWSERQSARFLEPWLHMIPVVVGWGTAIAGLPLDLYNSFGVSCWIGAYPYNCKDSMRNGGETDCIRGDNAWFYRIVFFNGFIVIVLLVSIFCMALIYYHVFMHERLVERSFKYSSRHNIRRLSKAVAGQAFFFTVLFTMTWIWNIAGWWIHTKSGIVYIPFLILGSIFTPLQGFLNTLVYLRPLYLRIRAKYTEASWWKVVLLVLSDERVEQEYKDRVGKDEEIGKLDVSSEENIESCPQPDPVDKSENEGKNGSSSMEDDYLE